MLLCPVCARSLRSVERQGIEIDHCAHCGGFWLDAGELDALIRQEAALALQAGQQALHLARHEREYDHAVPDYGTMGISSGTEEPLRSATAMLHRAAANVAARSR